MQGVTVPQEQLDCQRLLGRLQVPILGVLAFCGDYNLTFTQLDIRGVHIHTPMLAAEEFSVPWRLALLVFGSSIRTRIEGARVLNNNAGSAFAVANDATAELTGKSLIVNNHAGAQSILQYARTLRRTAIKPGVLCMLSSSVTCTLTWTEDAGPAPAASLLQCNASLTELCSFRQITERVG
jgi:hypothetical protein